MPWTAVKIWTSFQLTEPILAHRTLNIGFNHLLLSRFVASKICCMEYRAYGHSAAHRRSKLISKFCGLGHESLAWQTSEAVASREEQKKRKALFKMYQDGIPLPCANVNALCDQKRKGQSVGLTSTKGLQATTSNAIGATCTFDDEVLSILRTG